MNTALESDSTSDMMSMMNGRFYLPEKNSKYSTNEQGSLLGMATTLFQSEMRSFPPMQFSSLFPQQNMRPEDITSQVLAELADDSLFDPPSDDIFDIEPDPIPHVPHSQEQNRLALLEDTLNQVLSINSNFMTDQVVPVASPSSKHSLDPDMSSCAKRQRTMSEDDDDEDAARRFRPYQAEQWTEKFEELLEFRKSRGHCCVPHTFEENPSLARWVKRQRYQYKLKAEGKPSTMTDERIVALEQVGFVWDSHGAAWLERWQELVQFQQQYGHANVPSNHPNNPQLATWVKCQRRQYKLFWDGKPSNMNLERIQRLESVGFEWELRMSHKKK